MSRFSLAILLAAGVGLAACSNADRFGAGAGNGTAGPGGAGGVAVGALGNPADPTSIAHFQQRIGDRVFFTTDSSSLTNEARQILDGQARWLNDNRDYQVIIEGHADERGTREYNIALGERRANAVAEYLVSQGISRNRMRILSYGKERPVEACAEQRCWDLNRRAVTVISASGLGV